MPAASILKSPFPPNEATLPPARLVWTRKPLLDVSMTCSLNVGVAVPMPTFTSAVAPFWPLMLPRISELLCETVEFAPIAVELLREAEPEPLFLALLPIYVLSLPEPRLAPAFVPKKEFLAPVVVCPENLPKKELSFPPPDNPADRPNIELPAPDTLEDPAARPTNVLSAPLVLFNPAL